jgi:G:T-mismatch repair DNA endonuclease (very short patch repair protein)
LSVYRASAARLRFGRQTTCSRKCSYELRAALQFTGVSFTCVTCGKQGVRSVSQLKTRHGESFCSSKCAYKKRRRIVSRPYVLVADYDRSAAVKRAWATRRARGFVPSLRSRLLGRRSAIARAIVPCNRGGGVSKFEGRVGSTFRALGFGAVGSKIVRRKDGTFAHVFDLYIGARHIVVECHGTYWHGARWSWESPTVAQSRNLEYEERKLREARRLGLDFRIVWEHEFKRDPVGACLRAVR